MTNKITLHNYKYKVLTAIIFNICFANLIFAQSPSFQWAKSFGSTGSDFSHEIITDAAGNYYVAGEFEGTVDFDPGTSVTNLVAAGMNDAFVCKYDVSGNLVWARRMGGTSADVPYSICIDMSGNIFLTGTYYGTADFDPGAGTANLISKGYTDIFAVKLNSSGNYVWAKSIGGLYMDAGVCIKTDNSGNCYITGTYADAVDFDPGAGTTNHNAPNGGGFVLKLDASGNFSWVKNFSGSTDIGGVWLGIDNLANVVVTGYYSAAIDFDPGPSTYTLSSVGGFQTDVYVVKLNSAGNFVWAKSLGGSDYDLCREMSIDKLGNIYTIGHFTGTADFDPGTGTANLSASTATASEIFVSKLDASGNYLWAKKIGGSQYQEALGVGVDTAMACYVTGYYQGTVDFNPGTGVNNFTSAGSNDIFIEKLDASGNFAWAKTLGGTASDVGQSITVDLSGSIYTTGFYNGTFDFNTDAGVLNQTSVGASADVFVHKMGQNMVGIQENEWHNDFILYPNPVTNYFTIESALIISSLTITDVSGRIVYTQPVDAIKISVNTTTLSNGVYFIKTEDKNNRSSIKRLMISK